MLVAVVGFPIDIYLDISLEYQIKIVTLALPFRYHKNKILSRLQPQTQIGILLSRINTTNPSIILLTFLHHHNKPHPHITIISKIVMFSILLYQAKVTLCRLINFYHAD